MDYSSGSNVLLSVCTEACCTSSTSIIILSKAISLRSKMHTIGYVYSKEIYKFFELYFPKFYVYIRINAQNHDFHRFSTVFTIKIKFLPIFTFRFVIRATKYVSMQFRRNRRVHLFGTSVTSCH